MPELGFEPAAFRKALGSFATGVTIVTTCAGGEQFGVTANSFSSVSLDPPLVLWSLAKTSSSLAAFSSAPGFAVHVLASDQQELSNRFAKRNSDKFADLRLETGDAGNPLLTDCAARFECRTTYRYEGGDHIIFVGKVIDFRHGDKEPLLFHAGRYATRARDDSDTGSPDRAHEAPSDDLIYLIASSYFQLLNPVRRRAAEAGLSLSDHYALNVLFARGETPLAGINEIIGHLGLATDMGSIDGMASRGLVTVRYPASSDVLVTLTAAGQILMIELIATARAREADAEAPFGEVDTRLLKRLLGRFVKGLEAQEDGDRIIRHMNLMRDVAQDEAGSVQPSLDQRTQAEHDNQRSLPERRIDCPELTIADEH